jgi:hypothetical protein
MFAALGMIAGVVLVLVALVDTFEAMVLPRRITRRWRPARLFYRTAWRLWRSLGRLIPAGRYRENALSIFGPLSLLCLFAFWVLMLITGFALAHWAGRTIGGSGEDFREYLYMSGETFFTLGYGDTTPKTHTGKLFAVAEAGIGFGFMAIVIGYLPVLYQAFSRRELNIGLLDARAGSPPTAGELLRRSGSVEHCHEVERFLAEWEVWAAELLESHLSFPVLSFYRSQHDNQSWLAALATVLDVCSVLLVTGSEHCRRRAELTFAMARHACVDLCLVFWLPPIQPAQERLRPDEMDRLIRQEPNRAGDRAAERLSELRELYEPFLQALSDYFCLRVPRFYPDRSAPDNWQTSAWTKRAPAITDLPARSISADEHFG